jgi:hypothetical protein
MRCKLAPHFHVILNQLPHKGKRQSKKHYIHETMAASHKWNILSQVTKKCIHVTNAERNGHDTAFTVNHKLVKCKMQENSKDAW